MRKEWRSPLPSTIELHICNKADNDSMSDLLSIESALADPGAEAEGGSPAAPGEGEGEGEGA